MARRYTPEQLGRVIKDSKAKDWQGVLDYLDSTGPTGAGLGYDERAEMEEDLEKLKDREDEFSRDASMVYQLIESIQPVRTSFGPGTPPPGHEGQ